MQQQRVVRIQLAILALLVALVVVRGLIGPPKPDGTLVWTDLEQDELRHAVLDVRRATNVDIEATGSYDAASRALQAYPWILRRADRQVAWKMSPETASLGEDLLAETHTSTRLEAGVYDVFFTTYGQDIDAGNGGGTLFRSIGRLFRNEPHWTNRSGDWELVLRIPRDDAQVLPDGDLREASPEDVLWTSAPIGSRRHAEWTFQVDEPTPLRVYAVGELCEEPCDYGWIERAFDGERVWVLSKENAVPAGGTDSNRLFDGTVELAPGVYRAAFTTDRGHAFGAWWANPPFDPAGWGLTLRAPASATVSAFHPWQGRTPLVQLIQVPNRTVREAIITVERPTRMVAYGVGEIGGRGNLYDYGWLTNLETGERVWEMSYDASQPAGGDDSNREEVAFLDLDPGTYQLGYETDGSHAFGDWSNGRPEHPDRWGVSLFPLQAADADAVTVEVVDHDVAETPAEAPRVPVLPAPPLGTGTRLVDHTGLGDGARIEQALALDDAARLHIQALGEISRGGRYDYAWIERADDGRIVWEMTWENTEPAGGEERNRLFDGAIELPAGRYVVYYRTDDSHAYDDFSGRAPRNPERWGLVIERLDVSVPAPPEVPPAPDTEARVDVRSSGSVR